METALLEKDVLFFGIDEGKISNESIMKAFEATLIREDKALLPEIVETRNRLMRFDVCRQVSEKGYFEIAPIIQGTCTHCVGAGERYKFVKEPILETCPACKGERRALADCPTCGGTGRYKRIMADGNEIGVVCKHCKGEGRTLVRCQKCFGRGEVRKFVITPKIEGTTKCDRCSGIGVHLSRIKAPANPVITPEQAKEMIH